MLRRLAVAAWDAVRPAVTTAVLWALALNRDGVAQRVRIALYGVFAAAAGGSAVAGHIAEALASTLAFGAVWLWFEAWRWAGTRLGVSPPAPAPDFAPAGGADPGDEDAPHPREDIQ